jgi:hypothetical protein
LGCCLIVYDFVAFGCRPLGARWLLWPLNLQMFFLGCVCHTTGGCLRLIDSWKRISECSVCWVAVRPRYVRWLLHSWLTFSRLRWGCYAFVALLSSALLCLVGSSAASPLLSFLLSFWRPAGLFYRVRVEWLSATRWKVAFLSTNCCFFVFFWAVFTELTCECLRLIDS